MASERALPLDAAREVLRAQPFSVLLGAELVAFSAERTELHVPLRAEFRQQHGFAHGGVIAYAADNALTFAGGFALGPAVVTSEFKINYLRPARGTALVARASVLHAGRRQAVCRCEILDRDGDTDTLCAVAQGTISTLDAGSRSGSPA